MPKTKQVNSRDARQQWREILDDVVSGKSDITITRYGEPVAVLIPVEDYESLAEELEELRLGRIAEDTYAEYLANRESAALYEEFRGKLLEEN
jgi:prevent-host-death family protein